jgi:hypothetical protein
MLIRSGRSALYRIKFGLAGAIAAMSITSVVFFIPTHNIVIDIVSGVGGFIVGFLLSDA